MAKSLNQIIEVIENFCNQRDWKNNDPNQLISSVLIELGELAEHYQWKNEFKNLSEDEKKAIGYEFVDVLFYLLRLAGKSGINVEEYFDVKIKKLEEKYPIGSDWATQHNSYRKSGKSKKYD